MAKTCYMSQVNNTCLCTFRSFVTGLENRTKNQSESSVTSALACYLGWYCRETLKKYSRLIASPGAWPDTRLW